MNLRDVGYMSASRFLRLSASGIAALKPVTILLHKDEPVRVVVRYETYMTMQERYFKQHTGASPNTSA